jgi:hypothetical protein
MKRYKEDDNGYVRFENIPLSKAGVFPYLGSQLPKSLGLMPDQIYQVYRPESELNNPETIESFRGVPWYNKHVMTGDKFGVSPEEVGVHGSTGDNIEYRDGGLVGNLNLFAKTLKESIKAGLKELSCGFACVYELVSGVSPMGEKYDIIQREIRGNHLASVPQGRMGSEVSVAMDQLTFSIDELKEAKEAKEAKDGGTTMTLEEILAALKELKPSLDQMNAIQEALGSLGTPSVPDADAEGEREEFEAVAEDEDEDEDKPESGMDAAVVSSLLKTVESLQSEVKKLKGSAMDERAIMTQINKRNELGSQLSSVVGSFNYQEKTLGEVAKYGAKTLGIACDSGQEVAAVRAFLQGRKNPTFTVDKGNGQDSAVASSKALEDMGL